MKNKKGLSISKVTKYLPVLIILLSITIIIGSTFAYFTDTKEKESGLTFSKVELSNESNVGVNGTIKDVIPGSPLIVNPVQFSKGIDSEAIYVRAKLSFSLPRVYESDSKMLDLLDDIRNSTNFNIHSDEQNGAVWSSKQGNYYYLVLKDDNTLLKRVDTIDTYTLSNEIVVPRDLESLEDNYQYMKSINFHIAFEAIQADNVSNVLSETKETFNVTFPEVENEKFVQSFNLVFKGIDLTTTYEEVKVRAGEVTVEIEPPTHTNPKAQFVGWYSDSTFENQFTFGTTIEQNYTLYPKFSAGEKLTIMDTDNTTVLEEIMVEDGSYSTEPTLLQLPADVNGTHTKAVEGWYTEASYQNKFVFGTEISESTTLYPKLVDVSTGLQFTEVYEENELTRSSELVGYAVAKGECTDTEVIVPQVYNGLPVVQVADWGFGESNITKIVLPSTIKFIKGGAFYNCLNLIDVNLPSSLIELADSVFTQCNSLEYVVIPDGIYELNYTFNSCKQLKEVKLPKNLRVIGPTTFYECSMLKIDTLPDSVETIGGSAFQYCSNITLTSLPSSLTTVGDFAFYYCNKMILDNLPENLVSVGISSFEEIGKIKHLTISKNFTQIDTSAITGVIIDKISVDADNPLYNDGNGSNLLIETATKTIIRACNGTTSIPTSEDVVTGIGNGAFRILMNLTSLVIPTNITSIGDSAFSGCGKLVQVRNLSNCYLSGYENMDGEVLTDTTSEFTSSLQVDANGWEIFTNANGDKYLFGYKGATLSGEIPEIEGLSQIYNYAFYNNDKVNITSIPASINYIGQYSFVGCRNITQITSMQNIQNIPYRAFENCVNLESVTFANNLQAIESWAFKNCSKLSNVVLPETVISVGHQAFTDCDLVPIENDLRYVTYANGKKYVMECLNKSMSEVTFPENTSVIGSSLFEYFENLTSINIPEGVTRIQDGAFMGCTNLATVTLPSTLKNIGQNVFYMNSIESITLPNGLENIGGSAFARTKITSIEIPASVTNIGWSSFEQVESLKKVVINNANCWIENPFNDTPNLNGVILTSTSGYVSESFNNLAKEICYYGTSEQWDTLEGSEYITKTIHFYKEGCLHADEGYWQYNEQGFPIIGMSVEEVVKQAPTCEATGSKDIVCIHCDEVVSANIVIPKVPHNFVDGTCSECETAINYTITQGDPYGFEYFKGEYDTLYWNLNRYVDSSTSTLTLTASVDVIVTFEYWVDAGFGDYFALLKDSIEILQVENTNYQFIKYSVTLSAGEVLTFSYVKDAADSWNNDQLQIKDLTVADV